MSALNFNKFLLCTVNVLFAFAGIILNSIVIISFLKSQLRRKLCYFMILILACFDLAVATVLHLVVVLESLDPSKKISIIGGQLLILSLAAVLTMTVERYVAMVYPFFHQRFVTKSRLIALLVILQLPLTVFHIAKHIAKHIPTVAAVLLVLLVATFLVIFFLNYQILFIARKLQHRPMVPLGRYNGSDHSYLNKNQRKISTCSLAVACLTVCHFPHVVYTLLILTEQLNDDWSVTTFHHWADTIVAMNSSFNCVIFFYMNSTLRRHGWQIFRKTFNIRD
jgi:hypothetical protein